MSAHARPAVFAHRGASAYRPEHTRSAYELAFALGADAVEPDVVVTKDGQLVLRHENELSDTTDVAAHAEFADRRTTKLVDGIRRTGWFTEDFTWDELSTLRARERLGAIRPQSATFDGEFGLLRLEDLFDIVDRASDAAGSAFGIVLEVKHATYFSSIGLPVTELIADAIREAGWNTGDGRLVLESFERTALAALHADGIRGKRVYLIEAAGKPVDAVAALGSDAPDYADAVTGAGLYALATATGHDGIDAVSVDKTMVLATDRRGRAEETTDLVENAHAAGLEVYCWTLRPENQFLARNFRRGSARGALGDWRGEFRLVMSTGIDGVFADHPDLAVAARGSLHVEE